MRLPASAVSQIESMVHSFLPYEVGYEPKTPQSSLIEELYSTVAASSIQLRQWAGFVMYLMKQIDENPDKQKDVDTIAEAAHGILSRYGYDKVGKI